MEKRPQTFTMVFTGDYAPVNRYEKLLLKNKGGVFGDLLDDIAVSDISYVNLESPVGIKSIPLRKEGPVLISNPKTLQTLKDAGFTVVGLANNHILDNGPVGLEETVQECNRLGLKTVGAGKDFESSRRHLLLKSDNVKIALIAVAEHEFSIAGPASPGAAPLDPIDNSEQINRAKNEADLVFVTVHGGNEYFPFPRPGLRKICKFFIDCGADAVVCHHPHVPGAYEFYKKKPVIYSLGNLIFDALKPRPGWNEGYAAKISFNLCEMKLSDCEFIPYKQSFEFGGIQKLKGTEKDNFLLQLKNYNETLSNEPDYTKEWENFCAKNAKKVLLNMFSPIRFRGLSRINRVIDLVKFVFPKSLKLLRLNYVRCESHRELLEHILEKKC